MLIAFQWIKIAIRLIEGCAIEEKSLEVEPTVDVERKFVRIIRHRQGGYIEFQFSIHHKELFVELVLPAGAFEDFCIRNRVTLLDPL